MANTGTRTLRLLSLLQARQYWPGAELAERLLVSPRTLRRDIDRLRELGYPVQAQRLVGYDLARHDWRTFRLDRLSALAGTGARFRPRELPATDAAAFVRAGIDSAVATYDVEVLVDAPAAAVRERIGRWSTVEDIGATRCRVRMTADSLDWPTMALGAVGADFQVISPPELLGRVHDWGRRFSHATPSPATPDDRPG